MHGVMHKIMAVLELPPRLDFSILVSGLFLYGMCWSSEDDALRLMTWVRKKRDLLMCWPSRTRSFETTVCFYALKGEIGLLVSWMLAFSLPARSTNVSTDWYDLFAFPRFVQSIFRR